LSYYYYYYCGIYILIQLLVFVVFVLAAYHPTVLSRLNRSAGDLPKGG